MPHLQSPPRSRLLSLRRTAARTNGLFILITLWLLLPGPLSASMPTSARTSPPTSPPVVEVPGGTITAPTVWRADRVHRLTGVLHVAAGAVLRIEAGARIEGVQGGALIVDRLGRIEARGTLYEPIVFSCPIDQPQTRDCWDGLIITGNAPVNGGTMDSPMARGTGTAGCLQRTDDALAGPYGGCDPADDSGVLEYVRVQFAVRGLQLLGVGNGTAIDFVQVHAGGIGGLAIRGGTVDLRHVMVTSSGPRGVEWSGGWTGRLQHAVVQAPAEGGVGLLGRNDPVAPDAFPRSAPTLFNITVVQLPSTTASALMSSVELPPLTTGIRLSDGTAATLRNLFVAGFDVAVDIDGAESCALIAGNLLLEHAIVAGTGALGDPDTDAACADGAATEELLLSGPTIERITDAVSIAGLQKAGFTATLPDFRTLSPLFASRATVPPDDGFFLPSAFVGAVEIAMIEGANLPWYSGWTIGALVDPVLAFGSVSGIVSSPERGPFNGATVQVGSESVLTAPDGAYAFAQIPVGPATVLLATAPDGCTLPAPASVTVVGGSAATADFVATCTPPVITSTDLRLTYICENRFRVRNPNDAVVTVTWDVAGTSENGSLDLPARPIGGGFSETFFDTVATGTVRLFLNGTQIQVKANGGFTCAP